MSHVAIGCSITRSGPAAAHRADPQDAATAAIAAEATVTADISAAAANGTISGNSPALALVTQIQTDFNALIADIAPATASTVLLSYDPAVVLTRNQLRACVNAIMQVAAGASDLT